MYLSKELDFLLSPFCYTNPLTWGIEMFWDTVWAWPQFKTAKVAATHSRNGAGTWQSKLCSCTGAVSPGLLPWTRQAVGKQSLLPPGPVTAPLVVTAENTFLYLCCSTLSVFPNRFQASSGTALSPGKEGSPCCPGCWWPGRAHGAAGCHSTRESREGCNSFTSRGGRSRKSSSNAKGRKPGGNRSRGEGGLSWRSSSDCGGSIGKPSSRKSCWSICQGSRKNCSIRSSQGIAVSNSWGRHSCSPSDGVEGLAVLTPQGWAHRSQWHGRLQLQSRANPDLSALPSECLR